MGTKFQPTIKESGILCPNLIQKNDRVWAQNSRFTNVRMEFCAHTRSKRPKSSKDGHLSKNRRLYEIPAGKWRWSEVSIYKL